MRYYHGSLPFGLKTWNLIIMVTLLIKCASGQSVDESLLYKVQKYQAINHQEKIFVQTDRPVYARGEELWFSAFLFDAPSQRLNQSERVLYLELIDQEGIISQKNIFELEKGRAWGSIMLNPKLPPGMYYLLAYTNWMRNSGSEFYFSKQIYIGAEEDSVAIDTFTVQTIANSDNRRENEEVTSTYPSVSHLSFFPEGGNMIEGIQSKVAFEAVNENGQGINLDALVVDETGEIITAAKSLWKGKGFFMLKPHAGKKYFIRIIYDANREAQQFKLPEAKTDGLAMAVFDMNKKE